MFIARKSFIYAASRLLSKLASCAEVYLSFLKTFARGGGVSLNPNFLFIPASTVYLSIQALDMQLLYRNLRARDELVGV